MPVINEQIKNEDVENKIVDNVRNLSAIAEANAASTEGSSTFIMGIGQVIKDICENVENYCA